MIVFCICCVNGSNDVNLGVVVIVISVVVGIDCIVFGNYQLGVGGVLVVVVCVGSN